MAMPMDEKITLDRKSFEALVSDSRTSILKSLAERRKTLTELAAQFQLSPSTVKEHMMVLQSADLVVMKDEGRKWKYYELTRKGRKIVQPQELRIMIVLGLSALAIIGALFGVIGHLQPSPFSDFAAAPAATGMGNGAGSAAPEFGAKAMVIGEQNADASAPAAPAPGPTPAPIQNNEETGSLMPELAVLVVASIVFGASAGWLARKRA
jgi:DNA-binding transcriptional ArsR family regulator